MQGPIIQLEYVPVRRLFLIAFCLVLVLKLFLATRLDLYSDEIFYWLASTHPALAYSDLPFMTALLVAGGSTLDPGNVFAVRLLFILLGSCIPLLVYWIARPLTGKRQALESAALTLCLPLAAFLGMLAVPDVPLLVFGLLAIGCFERALRSNALSYWLATGIVVALGLSTHYRFFLYPLAAILFLVFCKSAWLQWRNPRLWVSMGIASAGLLPILWFNFTNQLSSAHFYFLDRHPWSFQASGLLHVFKQVALTTPLLYGVFLYTLWRLLRQAVAGVQTAALFASFALTNLLIYLLLAPWTDATSTSIHWPLSGYFPLLVWVPAMLREIYQYCIQRWSLPTAYKLLSAVPLLGFFGTLVAFIGVGSQGFHAQLQPLLGAGVLSNKMAGWTEFAEHTKLLLAREFPTATPVIITDNYYTIAQLEFAGVTESGYTLDRDKAVNDGRSAQLQLWRKDESGLIDVIGKPALFISEDSTLDVISKHSLLARLCSHASKVELMQQLSLFEGDKQFSFYRVEQLMDYSGRGVSRYPLCPFPARAWLDFPADGARLQGMEHVRGWAYNEDIGILEVHLLIDGRRFARLNYGIERQDVVQVMGVETDPGVPTLGFDLMLDTTELSNGRHRLAIELVNRLRVTTGYGEREIFIEN